jgi:nitronate monooxygenase
MGGVAGGLLAAAVSASGGLGMIGMGTAGSATALRRELGLLGDCTRFGIGLVDWVMRREPDLWGVALDAGPRAISVSFGDDLGWVREAQAAGATAITQVFDVEGARRAQDAGIDVVVARGLEGGGHGAPQTAREDLLAGVVQAVDVPVLAAGAIAGRADVVAVLAAGAAGVWVGTAFAACSEALTTAGQRAAMIAATGHDTVLTRTVDTALGFPWPAQFPSRMIANKFLRQWEGRESELASDPCARAELVDAMAADDTQTAPVDAGTGVGAIVEVKTAAQVVSALSDRVEPA